MGYSFGLPFITKLWSFSWSYIFFLFSFAQWGTSCTLCWLGQWWKSYQGKRPFVPLFQNKPPLPQWVFFWKTTTSSNYSYTNNFVGVVSISIKDRDVRRYGDRVLIKVTATINPLPQSASSSSISHTQTPPYLPSPFIPSHIHPPNFFKVANCRNRPPTAPPYVKAAIKKSPMVHCVLPCHFYDWLFRWGFKKMDFKTATSIYEYLWLGSECANCLHWQALFEDSVSLPGSLVVFDLWQLSQICKL